MEQVTKLRFPDRNIKAEIYEGPLREFIRVSVLGSDTNRARSKHAIPVERRNSDVPGPV